MATMVRLAGPFDEPHGVAVTPATPTCCCCCCCLNTILTASTVAAIKVHREAELAGLPTARRWWATIVAALAVVAAYPVFLPVALISDALGIAPPDWFIAAGSLLLVVGTWAVMLRLAFALADAPARGAWKWTALFVTVTAVAFLGEFFSVGLLLYGQLAAIPVALAVGFWFRRRLHGLGP